MRISAINNINYNRVNIGKKQNQMNANSTQAIPTKNNNVNFSGKARYGGSIGSIVGTLAGIGLGAIATAATGGLAAPLLLGTLGCASGAIGGDIIDHKIRPGDDNETDDYDPMYPNHRDY